jgi:hypothetical protein
MSIKQKKSISRIEVITELRRVYFEYFENTQMTADDFSLHSKMEKMVVRRHFFSWQNALNQAKINCTLRPKLYTKKSIIVAIRKVYFEYFEDKRMTADDFCLHSKIDKMIVRRHFGTWKNTLKQAEINYYSSKPLEHNQKTIIAELRRVYFKYFENRQMTVGKFSLHSKINKTIIRRHFGTWRNALNQAKIKYSSKPLEYNEKTITATIRKVYFGYFKNTTMRFRNFRKHSKIENKTIIKYFGSWQNALNQAEINCSLNIKEYKKNTIIAAIRRVYFEYFENTRMSLENFRNHTNISYHKISKYLGSWENALKQAEINYSSKPLQHNEKSIIAAIREVYFEHFENTLMTVENFYLHSKISYYTVRSHFDSWENALKQAEIKYTSKKFIVEQKREQVLDDLSRIKEYNQGTYFTYTEYKEKSGRYNRKEILYLFECESWKKLLEKELNIHGKQKTPVVTPIVYTETQLFTELKRVWEKYGRRPTYSEFRKNTTIPIAIYENKFKVWGVCIEKFCSKNNGYNSYKNSSNSQTSETELLQELKNMKENHQKLTLTFKEYKELGGKHTIINFRDYFGNWEKAMELAGLKSSRYKNNSPNSIQLLKELQKIIQKLGRKPKPQEINELGKYPLKHYRLRFGSAKKSFAALADRLANNVL